MGFKEKKERKKWPGFGTVIKKTVVQLFDVLGKKKKKYSNKKSKMF